MNLWRQRALTVDLNYLPVDNHTPSWCQSQMAVESLRRPWK